MWLFRNSCSVCLSCPSVYYPQTCCENGKEGKCRKCTSIQGVCPSRLWRSPAGAAEKRAPSGNTDVRWVYCVLNSRCSQEDSVGRSVLDWKEQSKENPYRCCNVV
ncbi:hypothetical protein MHYP_G00305290 [Metynnis hypsauchen]